MHNTLHIWNPRPEAIDEQLHQQIFLHANPMMTITPCSLDTTAHQALLYSDWLIFTSVYAIKHLMPQLNADEQQALNHKIIMAIGKKTATALTQAGIEKVITSNPPHNSESLINSAAFEKLVSTNQVKNPLIVGGKNGRSLLLETLLNHGKNANLLVCYQRDKRAVCEQVMIEFLKNYCINSVLLTSVELVDCVLTSLPSAYQSLLNFPAFALSERIKVYAQQAGFRRVIVAASADKQALYQTIITWWEGQSV